MNFLNLVSISLWANLIEFTGALLIIGYILAALATLVRTRDVERGRYLAASGMIAGLGFKLAGTLLKMLHLHTWQAILMFTALLVLRTSLKRFFIWQQAQLKSALQTQFPAGDH